MYLLPNLNHHMPKASGRQWWQVRYNILVMNNSNAKLNGQITTPKQIAGHSNRRTTWSLNQQHDWMLAPMLDCQCEACRMWYKPWWWMPLAGGKPKLKVVRLCLDWSRLRIPMSRMKSPARDAPKLWPVPMMVVQWGQVLWWWELAARNLVMCRRCVKNFHCEHKAALANARWQIPQTHG
jgi:hypothetical protein